MQRQHYAGQFFPLRAKGVLSRDEEGKDRMAVKKPNYAQQRAEATVILIKDIKSRAHLTNKEIASMMGMPLNTFSKRIKDPSSFRLWELWNFLQAAGGFLEQLEDRKAKIL